MISFFLVFIFLSSSWAQQRVKELTLEECILQAVKNNLDVAIEILRPELADASLSRAKEKFMPRLSLSYNRRETNSASYSWIEAAEQTKISQNNYSAEISQVIPTGGSFSVSLGAVKSDTNLKFQTIDPRYEATLSFDFAQPLLRDFGYRTSRKEIIIAQNNREISENDLKQTLLETIYKVEEAYWNLVYSIENLNVKKQSLELARDTLAKTQKEVEIGTIAPKEILSAQAEVASREADILQAEAQVKNQIDLLKTIMNLPAEEGITEIVPVDKPAFERRDISFEEAFRIALENRPDMQTFRIDMRNKEVELGYARNQLLPALNLNASYWSPGMSGTRIMYQDDNPLTGIIVGTVPGGVSGALKDAMNFMYKNWYVYLTLDIPLNTVFSRAAVTQAKVNMKQAALQMENQEKLAFLEITTAVRAVETDYRRVQAYKIARDLAEKKLEAEEAKLMAGLSSNYFVLQYQRDLAIARSAELKSLIDYNLSLSQLDKALGITLKNRNISLSEIRPF